MMDDIAIKALTKLARELNLEPLSKAPETVRLKLAYGTSINNRSFTYQGDDCRYTMLYFQSGSIDIFRSHGMKGMFTTRKNTRYEKFTYCGTYQDSVNPWWEHMVWAIAKREINDGQTP